jgi:hypothetical protein
MIFNFIVYPVTHNTVTNNFLLTSIFTNLLMQLATMSSATCFSHNGRPQVAFEPVMKHASDCNYQTWLHIRTGISKLIKILINSNWSVTVLRLGGQKL